MIITLTANACLDHTIYAPSLDAAATPLRECIQAGGKGVNVARILHALGEEVHSVVLVGGETGERIVADLRTSDIPHTAVQASGNSRTYLEHIEAGSEARPETSAECGEPPTTPNPDRCPATQHSASTPRRSTKEFLDGLRADADATSTLFDVIDALLPKASWLAVCGSLAPGLPENFIAKLIARCRERRVLCAVDSHGAALTYAWRAGPDLLRVNLEEAAEALHCAPQEVSIERCFALGHATRGVISDGENAFLAWGGARKRFRVTPPRVNTLNPTGCGDAMLAGLLFKLVNTRYCSASEALRHVENSTSSCATPTGKLKTPESFTRALRFATALAAAEAEAPFAGHPNLQRAAALTPQVKICTLR